ncbi:MAG: cupin domain-containing protein, partial [Xanthobacteraceae bacterium]
KAVLPSAVFLLALASAAAASDIRRVVTTIGPSNKAVVLSDSRLTLATSTNRPPSANLWATTTAPADYSFKQDAAEKASGISPPDNGTVFRVVEFPPLTPQIEAKMEPELLMKVVGDHAPKRGIPVTHPLMHRTRTIDYAVVLSGEIDMMLDDSTVHVKAGDVVVQQATNHAWINRSNEPCRILFVLMDAKEP